MKKIISCVAMIMMLLILSAAPSFADEFSGGPWSVVYDGTKLNADVSYEEMGNVLNQLLPGDSVTFTYALKNESKKDTSWWMNNKILDSFEDNSKANGGAYGYKLSYIDSKGETNILYSSDTVGGEDNEAGTGLHAATNALENYFFLEDMAAGKQGSVVLEIDLDGETQGNGYQSTLADIEINFAVEDVPEDPTTPTTPKTPNQVVRTGDESNARFYFILAGLGAALMILAVVIMIKGKRNNKEAN